MAKIKLPVIYSQWDNKWAKEILGYNSQNSGFDLYNYGCLITCLAMALEYYGKPETPKDINEDLKDSNGFAKDSGDYVWGSAQKIFKQIENEEHIVTPYPLTDDQMSEINKALDYGFPVLVQVDYNPKTVKPDQHFVLLIGRNPNDENDYTVADPLGGVERSLKHYLGWFRPSARKTIESYTVLEGKVPASNALKDQVIDFDDPEGKRRSVMWYVTAWFDQKVDKNNQKKEFEDKLNKKDEAFSQNATLLNAATQEVARKETKIQQLTARVQNLEAENSRLVDQNSALFGIVDLIKIALNKINLLPKK